MKLKSLSIGYIGSAPIVSAIEAELCHGQFTCLLGRNGTGKSTLLRTLAGLQNPLHGQIIFDIRSIESNHSTQPVALVTPHCPELFHTSVREFVTYGRLPYSGVFGGLSPADHEATDLAMCMVGIEALAERFIHTLSDGEKQKALIARSLAQESPILLLDEPSAFLDYPSRCQLMEMLVHLSHDSGRTILLSTHDVELAAQYADQLWIIKDHNLIKKTPQDFHPEEL